MKRIATLEFGRQDIINILEKYYSVKLKNVTMSYFGIKAEEDEK